MVLLVQHCLDSVLQDIDMTQTPLAPYWRGKLVELLVKFESILSRHGFDCSEVKGFVHRICLSDIKPIRLPTEDYHHHTMRNCVRPWMTWKSATIIRKSAGDYASPSGASLEKEWRSEAVHRLPLAKCVKDAHLLHTKRMRLQILGRNA